MNDKKSKVDEIELTRRGKDAILIQSPVMPAAGTFGFGEMYRGIINVEKLGAIVTNPVTYEPRQPAIGTRVIELDAGVLIHTGLPNPGLSKVLKKHRNLWTVLPIPIILHFVATTHKHVKLGMERINEEACITGVELGLPDDISWQDAEQFTKIAVASSDKPVIVRLPLQDAYEIASAVADAGAAAVTVAAPPRGTARDPINGRLVPGRIYGPLIKPIVLHTVGKLVRRLSDEIPVIGAGGIHSQQDARDYIEAGARAVQVDSVTWIQPKMLEYIARDLGAGIVTRESDAMPDEWHPGLGDTEKNAKEKKTEQSAKDS